MTICCTATARTNDATEASFSDWDLEHPFAEGAFRWVAKGVYTAGPRRGEPCVCKWFKNSGLSYEEKYFQHDIKAVDKAMELISQWNQARIVDRRIQMNRPEVWTFKRGSTFAKRKVLQEPHIHNWQKFNSNSGWALEGEGWPQIMQALSHYSYHISRGQFVLCDLQGGIYNNGAVLTDPVILSQGKQYGCTDLGPSGISTFFAHHRCNKYCRSDWLKPQDFRSYHAKRRGTTMASDNSGKGALRALLSGGPCPPELLCLAFMWPHVA